MNPEQRSVTAAFVVVTAGIAVRHHWPSRLATWIGKPPQKAVAAPTGSVVPIGGINDWQAAIVLYGLLMLLGETQAAPVGPPIAWAVGLVMLFSASGILAKEYPSLFGGTDAVQPQGRSNVPQGTGSTAKTVAG